MDFNKLSLELLYCILDAVENFEHDTAGKPELIKELIENINYKSYE